MLIEAWRPIPCTGIPDWMKRRKWAEHQYPSFYILGVGAMWPAPAAMNHEFSPWRLAWLRSISQHEPIRSYLLRLGTTVTTMREIASTAIHQHKSISNVKPHLCLVKWQYSSHYSIQYNLVRNIFCDSQACMVKGKGWGWGRGSRSAEIWTPSVDQPPKTLGTGEDTIDRSSSAPFQSVKIERTGYPRQRAKGSGRHISWAAAITPLWYAAQCGYCQQTEKAAEDHNCHTHQDALKREC